MEFKTKRKIMAWAIWDYVFRHTGFKSKQQTTKGPFGAFWFVLSVNASGLRFPMFERSHTVWNILEWSKIFTSEMRLNRQGPGEMRNAATESGAADWKT